MSEKSSRDLQQSAETSVKAGKAAVKGAKRVKSAAKSAKGAKTGGSLIKLLLSTPHGKIIALAVVALLLAIAIMTGGVPATSFNSFTHVNENQDACDPVATQNSDMDNLNSATIAEAEGINILGEILSQEKAKVEEEVKKACNDLKTTLKNPTKTISVEATLQMLDANFVALGSDTYAAHAEGTYSEEEYDAGLLLSAYSVSMDNLWGESEDTNMGDGIQGAIDWALMIAADDSFAYGKSPAANHYGCYFCGNQQTKQKHAKRLGINRSYAKTYCCNTFITAAYVHGAGDEYLACRGGKGINNCALTKAKLESKKQYTNFEYLGHISASSLQPGDVLVSPKHVKMYIGSGKQVESTGGKTKHCWGPESIHVSKFKYGSQYVVIRYIGGGAGYASGSGVTGALKWAKKIADDDNYYYSSGYGKCHTCNGGKKAYVCTTFVKAAFAHGAGDAEMLKWCKNNSYGMVRDLHAAMKRSKNWKSLGAVSQKNMKAGDVLVYGNSHVEIYYGNGKQIGAHNSSLSKAKQISVRANYTSGLTDVMRYTGSGGTAGYTNEYNSKHVNGTISKSDCKVAARIRGEGNVSCPQSFAYLGDNKYVVAYSNTTQGDTRQYLKKFRGSTCIGKKSASLGHANGLTYNEKTGKLYSVRGSSKLCKTFNASNLKSTGSITLPYGTSGIAYDNTNNRYYLSSGSNLRVVDSNFKSVANFKKKGQWVYAQDIGGANGVMYSCVCTNKSGKNKICLYDSNSNGYCGEYKLNWSGCEIEGCAVDETGHLLILMNRRGSNTDYIYKTKEVMAQAAGSTYAASNESYADEKTVDGEGIAKSKANSSVDYKHNINASKLGAVKMTENWRIDIREKFEKYLQDHDFYKLRIDRDENGDPIVYDGVISGDEDNEEIIDEYKDHVNDDIIDLGDESEAGSPITDEEDARQEYEEYLNSDLPGSKAAAEADAKKKEETEDEDEQSPNLKRASYLKIRLEKADIYDFAKSAFNVKKKDITEHYGKGATEIEALDGMTRSSLALLHGVDDFEEDLYSEDLDAKYKISDTAIGEYTITAYCNCKTEDSCKKNRRKLFGKANLPTSLKRAPYATAAASRDIPLGTILYIKKLDKIVVVEEHLSGANENTVAIFTGKKHENYETQVKAMKSVLKNGKSKIFLVTGLTQGEAKNLATGGVATGSWLWPVRCHTISSEYGWRICPFHGKEFHGAYDIAASSGTPVHAASGGTVTSAGYNGGYGYSITITHSRGLTSMYNHMLAGSLKFKKGDTVSRGDVIGKVGSTGSSTGPHLDFRVTVNGKNVDPLTRYPGTNLSNPSTIDKYYPTD